MIPTSATRRAPLGVELPAGTPRRIRLSWAFGDQGVVSFCNFFSTFLLARYMPIAEFGIYTIAAIALLFLNSVQSAAITQPHNILGASLQDDAYRRFTGILATFQLAGATLIGLVFVALAGLADALNLVDRAGLVLLFGLMAIPWMNQEFIRRIHYTRSNPRAAFFNDLISYGLQLAGIVLLVRMESAPSTAAALWILGGSSLVASLFGAWQLRNEVAFRGWGADEVRAVGRDVKEFGAWLVGRNLLTWVGQYGNVWLLLGLLGPAALGAFRAATHLLNVLNPIRLAVASYLPSQASASYSAGGRSTLGPLLRRAFLGSSIPFLGLAIVLAFFADGVLELAYGDKFQAWDLRWVLILCAGAAFLEHATAILETGLLAMRRPKLLMVNSLINSLLLLTVGLVLIDRFELLGAAVASLVMGGAVLGISAIFYGRVRPGEATAAGGR